MSLIAKRKEDRIRQYLKAVTFSIRDTNFSRVATGLGLGRNTLSQYVSGRTSITMKHLLPICRALNIPLVVLDRKEFPSPENIGMWNSIMLMPQHEVKSMLNCWHAEKRRLIYEEALKVAQNSAHSPRRRKN